MPVTCYGIDPDPFACRVRNPERPGEYCFPPLASLITAAARLMLALLERCVTDLGGTYAMEDTDSMAIVATQRGGLIEFPGGPYRKNGKPAIQGAIVGAGGCDRQALRGAESLRSQPRSPARFSRSRTTTSTRRPDGSGSCGAWRFPPSDMRSSFAIQDGEPALLREGVNNKEDRYSEHGLGHLLNPTDPESDDRSWIAQAWLNDRAPIAGSSDEAAGL